MAFWKIFLYFIITLPFAWLQKPSAISDFALKLDECIPVLMREFPTEGLAIAIIENGEVAFQNCYGYAHKEEQIKVTPKTVFNVASISKSFTSWAVFHLAEQGLINLDAPVNSYLKKWKLTSNQFRADDVLIRDVLCHSAGLNTASGPGFGPEDELVSIVDYLVGKAPGKSRLEIIFDPGTRTVYSNSGYGLLQLLIEDVSGMPFNTYMESVVFYELGLKSSYFLDPSDPRINEIRAQPYDWRGVGLTPERFVNLAAAGLLTTLDDMVSFARYELGAPQNLLQPKSLQMLHTSSEDNGTYGPGHMITRIDGETWVGHTGLNMGWAARYLLHPGSDSGIIILTNNDNGTYIHQALAGLWLFEVFGLKNSLLVAPIEKKLNRLDYLLEADSLSGKLSAEIIDAFHDIKSNLRGHVKQTDIAGILSESEKLEIVVQESGLPGRLSNSIAEISAFIKFWLNG